MSRLQGAALVAVAVAACGGGFDTGSGPTLQSRKDGIAFDARTEIVSMSCQTEPYCPAPGVLGPGECMDTGGSFDPGNSIVQYSCQHYPDQQFRLDQVDVLAAVFQIVSCAGVSCRVTGVDPGSLCVGANPSGPNDQAQDGDSITLMPCLDGSRVRPQNTRWRTISDDLRSAVSHASFRSALPSTDSAGKCIDVPGGYDWDGLPLQLFHCHGGNNQRWQLSNW